MPDVLKADVARLGPQVEAHARFPQRVNAGFMQIMNEKTARLRVFERGVGQLWRVVQAHVRPQFLACAVAYLPIQ